MSLKDRQKILTLFETLEEKNIKLAFSLMKANKISIDVLSEYLELAEFLEKHGRLKLNEDIEITMLKLLNLKFLSLPYFKLTDLPNKINFLVNLEDLNLDHNDFDIFPENICELPSLKRLSLAFNKLNDLPKNLDKLRDLESLDLSSNKFEKMPPYIYSLKRSTFLSIQNNPLSKNQTEWLSNHFPNCQINHWYK